MMTILSDGELILRIY